MTAYDANDKGPADRDPLAGDPLYAERVAVQPRSGGAPDDRPLTTLFADLANETAVLMRKEIELAKTELSEKVGQAVRGAVGAVVGGTIALVGLLFLLWALAFGLALLMPLWLATLIVGVLIGIVGYVLLRSGLRKLSAEALEPKRTIETIKDDGRWAKSQAKAQVGR